MPLSVLPVVQARAQLGEGPVWDAADGCLYWVDIDRHEVHRYHESTGDEMLLRLDVPVGAVVPRAGGGLVVAAGMGFATVDRDATVGWVARVGAGDRMNDGGCDPAGRFLAGTMTYDRSPRAALYRLEPDGAVTTLLTGVATSNGLGWSPQGDRLYYVDTPTRRVDVFDYDVERGVLGTRRVFVDIGDAPGNPDGLTVDAEGGVWVVLCRGRTVRRFTPAGALDAVIDVPVSRATSAAFGGAGLDTLYITSGRFDLDDEQLRAEPLAGSLLSCRPGVAGLPTVAFAG
jgi:sugar lactone lactonase YvrE